MATSSPTPRDGRYRVRVGERSFDVVFERGEVRVDDASVAARFTPLGPDRYAFVVDGASGAAYVEADAAGTRVTLGGRTTSVRVQDENDLLLARFGLADDAAAAAREVHAPMPGLVLQVLVEPGQAVAEGDGLVVLEAMKMENELRAATSGTVRAVHVAPGDAVRKNALLVEFEEA